LKVLGGNLNGVFNMGDLETGKEARIPLFVSSNLNSGSSRGKGLGIGAGAVGGVKPVDLDGCES
jgi:hypothetical protein